MTYENELEQHRKDNFKVTITEATHSDSDYRVGVTRNGYQWTVIDFTSDELRTLRALLNEFLRP